MTIERQNILDHGYVAFIESYGSDERIVEAARMSTDKGFLGWGPHDVHGQGCPMSRASGTLSGNSPGGCSCRELKTKPGDEKLLRYLYENNHATPFEMAGLVIEVQAPIFVFREWHRHRTQCLAGESLINLVTPNGTTCKRTIEEIFRLKYGGVIDTAPNRHKNGVSKAGSPVTRAARRKDPWRVRVLPNCQTRVMRTFDEETQTYRIGVMRDVWESGVKELWEVVTTAGRLRTSSEHPFLTKGGWAKMSQLRIGEMIATSGKVATHDRPIPPSLRQGIGVWTTMMRSRLIAERDHCYICAKEFLSSALELDHVIPVTEDLTKALDPTNLKPACAACHRSKTDREQPQRVGQSALGLKWARVLATPERVAEAMTYDLEMVGPDHNYVANGLVVHNSYNEMSARYTPLPDVHYMPTGVRCFGSPGQPENKQAQGHRTMGGELTHEEVNVWLHMLDKSYRVAEETYKLGLTLGIPKEIARCPVPVARYSRMRASANLRNWLAFLTLREAPNAQWEIRQFAHAVSSIIAEVFPRTHALYVERRDA